MILRNMSTREAQADLLEQIMSSPDPYHAAVSTFGTLAAIVEQLTSSDHAAELLEAMAKRTRGDKSVIV